MRDESEWKKRLEYSRFQSMVCPRKHGGCGQRPLCSFSLTKGLKNSLEVLLEQQASHLFQAAITSGLAVNALHS